MLKTGNSVETAFTHVCGCSAESTSWHCTTTDPWTAYEVPWSGWGSFISTRRQSWTEQDLRKRRYIHFSLRWHKAILHTGRAVTLVTQGRDPRITELDSQLLQESLYRFPCLLDKKVSFPSISTDKQEVNNCCCQGQATSEVLAILFCCFQAWVKVRMDQIYFVAASNSWKEVNRHNIQAWMLPFFLSGKSILLSKKQSP